MEYACGCKADGDLASPHCPMHGDRERATPAPGPTWRRGKPPSIGIWLVQLTTKDLVVAEVEADADDDGKPYLRSCVDGDTWPLDDPDAELSRFAARSYGPIPCAPRDDAG